MKLDTTNPTAASGLEVGQAASLPAAPAGAKSVAKVTPAVGRLAACPTLPGALRRGLGWLLGLTAGVGLAAAQGTAFSYQGQLTDGAAAANGTYDLNFTLWNAATGGDQQGATLTQAGVGVTNGLFTATLDFGGQFTGANRWLEIAVRTNGAADFTTLAERQPVLPTPYAIHAATATTATTATTVTGNVPVTLLAGTLSAAQIPDLDASKITGGTFTGNGSGLTSLNASTLSSGTVPAVRIPDLDAGKITSGVLAAERIPGLDASKVTAGVLADARIPSLDASKVTAGTFAVARIPNLTTAQIPGLDATKITSGVLSPDRIPTLDASKISGGTFAGNGAGLTEIQLQALVQDDYAVAAWGRSNESQTTVPGDLGDAVVRIAAGALHNLGLRADGTVVAWGLNTSGQSSVPAGLGQVVSIAAGRSHSLALRADGTVVAWGEASDGKTTVPAGLQGVVAVAAGRFHSLALRADGTVVAWGNNSHCQTCVPNDLNGVVAIAGGRIHSMALKADGTVVAWGGDNLDRQAEVPGWLSGVVAIAAGGNHSLALKADGTVVKWGHNSRDYYAVPAGLSDVAAIAAGEGHFLALRSNGSVVAWGENVSGQTTVPSGLSGVKAVAAGEAHSLVLKTATTEKATLARLDQGNVFRGAVSALGFSGDGSGLTSLNASALTAGTLSDARLSANVALLNGNTKFTSKVSIGGGTADSPLTVAATGAGLSPEIVTRFRNTTAGQHTGVAVDALGGQDAVLYLGNNGVREWDFRYDDSSGELQFRTQPDNVSRMVLTRTGNLAVTGALSQASDRNVKAGFAPVDVEAVLAKVAALPLTTWHYTNDAAATPHLGPMAQDFHAAFGLGGDDKTITTVDADGVALAAIQGLHHRTETLAAENAVIREELARQQTANADLREELGELRSLVLQLQQQLNANRP